MKKFALAIFILSLLGASPVMAYNGNTLMKFCQNHIDIYEGKYDEKKLPGSVSQGGTLCLAIIRSVSDTIKIYDILNYSCESERYSCIPDDVDLKEKVRVVQKYLTENPKRRHINAVGLILEAFSTHYPCSISQHDE